MTDLSCGHDARASGGSARRIGCRSRSERDCPRVLWLRLGPLPDGLLDETARRRRPSSSIGTACRSTRRDRRGGTRARRPRSRRRCRLSLVNATLAAEDRRFCRHPGVDPIAFARAAMQQRARGPQSWKAGRRSRSRWPSCCLRVGGAGGARARIGGQRCVEAVVALRLEHRLTQGRDPRAVSEPRAVRKPDRGRGRRQQVYFGVRRRRCSPWRRRRSSRGFRSGRPAYNPYRRSQAGAATRQRQLAIIDRMRGAGAHRCGDAHRSASASSCAFSPLPSRIRAPHFVEMVLARTRHAPGRASRRRSMQNCRRRRRHRRGSIGDLERHGAHNVAVVVLDNRRASGWRGKGRATTADGDHGGAINGARRAAAARIGAEAVHVCARRSRAATRRRLCCLTCRPLSDGGAGRGLHARATTTGSFTVRCARVQALAGSQNVPAVALASRVGVPDLLRFLDAAGFTSFDKTASHYGLGLTLGNAEVPLAELVGGVRGLRAGRRAW